MRGPRLALSLILLLLAAILVLSAGMVAARRTEHHRVAADRQLLVEISQPLQEEVRRLGELYESHLTSLTSDSLFASDKEIPALCAQFHGLQSCLRMRRKGNPATLYEASKSGLTSPPEIRLFDAKDTFVPAFVFPVFKEIIFGKEAKGWLSSKQRGWMALYFRQDADTAIVLLINLATVQNLVSENLTSLLSTSWLPLKSAGELARVEGPDKRTLAGVKPPESEAADLVIPFGNRFGTWQLMSWDRKTPVVVYHEATLFAAGLLSAVLAVLAVSVYSIQKKALKEVTARVSFVNRVTHEIGTPLTNLNLYLDLARDALPETGSEECARRIAIAGEESARLGRLVSNVLTFARTERNNLPLSPTICQPAGVIEEVLEQFSPALKRRGIAVETNLDRQLTAWADSDTLKQIISNLVSNVEKYAAAGQLLQITLTRSPDNNSFVISVSDCGPGIPPDQLERVFQPFERLHSNLTEGVTGAGLGLAIVRELTQRMTGKVEATNLPAGGMQFDVTLPLGELPKPAPADSLQLSPA